MISKISAKLGALTDWVIQKSVLNELLETQLLATGKILSNLQDNKDSDNLNDFEFKIFSQFGDDGIIQYLTKKIDIKNKTFIEFGVEDYSESNTRFLMMNDNWSGFVMDGSENSMRRMMSRKWYWKHDLTHASAFIDTSNVNSLLDESGFSDVGLLHIDLDGNDYWILEALNLDKFNPSILIMEYNSVFGAERAITTPYDPSFVRTDKHYSNLYFGASLKALTSLAQNRGYELIGCNDAGNNAYYVRRDLLNKQIRSISVTKAFKNSKFRESRNENLQLSFKRGEERLETIKGLMVFNVETGKTEKI